MVPSEYSARIDPVVTALAAQHAELAGLLGAASTEDWHRPSPCEEWDVADVVLHLAQTDELAVGSLLGRFDEALAQLTEGLGEAGQAGSVDDGAALMVAAQRTDDPAAVFHRWRAASARLRLTAEEVDLRQAVTWVAGQLAARSLVTTRLAETWIHTGDVASAVQVELPATDRLWHIARLAWRTLPYALVQDGRELSGPVTLDLRGPGGDTWTFSDDDVTTGEPVTTVTGDALELCLVAARRVPPSETSLVAEGPDGEDVLRLIRTYA